MKRKTNGPMNAVKCYFTLIAWVICAALVIMTFFNLHCPGEWLPVVCVLGVFAELYFLGKYGEKYPLPNRFRPFVMLALVISALFAFSNFWLSMIALKDGMPRIVDGTYVLDYKGTVAAYLTEEEYHRLKCIEQRFCAGHTLFFYAGLMFLHCDKKVKVRLWPQNKVKRGDL